MDSMRECNPFGCLHAGRGETSLLPSEWFFFGSWCAEIGVTEGSMTPNEDHKNQPLRARDQANNTIPNKNTPAPMSPVNGKPLAVWGSFSFSAG